MEELNKVLNEDLLLVKILPRSRAEDVHRLKAVSKDWGSYLSSSQFSRDWCQAHRQNNFIKLALQVACPAKLINLIHGEIRELRQNLEIICSSNGHFCCLETSLSSEFSFSGNRLMAWPQDPVVVTLAVCSPVFKQKLPQLLINGPFDLNATMVVDPNGHYTVGFLTGSDIAVYDSKIGEWRRHGRMAWPEVDFTTMDLGSCVYNIRVSELRAYDFIKHRRGSLKIYLPALQGWSQGQFFHYGNRLFCASFIDGVLKIHMMEHQGRRMSFDVPCESQMTKMTRKPVLMAVEGNLLIAIVHLKAEQNRCVGVIFDLENYTWSIHDFLEERGCYC